MTKKVTGENGNYLCKSDRPTNIIINRYVVSLTLKTHDSQK